MNAKPRSLFRARPHGLAPSFNQAMLSVAAEDLAASPCVTCNRKGDYIGAWSPTPAIIARELDGDPEGDRQILYRLCSRCARRCQTEAGFTERLESIVCELWRSGYVHKIKDGRPV